MEDLTAQINVASADIASTPELFCLSVSAMQEPTRPHLTSISDVQLYSYRKETLDTMASTVLADPTRALHGTNKGNGPAMEASENAVGSLEQLLLYADENYLDYLAGKLPLETI
ncbi:hypothetical protein TNCV_1199601 [Trichonephila clavipes]|uniref:Uncharacterized protein n=1 Tax=Trichonephila clavipes TaxID=2585209 RepID=A0A8X6S7A4_TRICX|nr:hypothetical protein TNCV_1199601 [Trichonephila clavipes]